MCSSQLLCLAPWTNELTKRLELLLNSQSSVERVPGWFLEEQQLHMATRISGERVARRVCRQDYAAGSTPSSAQGDLWQILYPAVILLCVMVALGNIREKWSATSQAWEGGGVWFSPRIWFNPVPRESDSGEGAASCCFLSVHLPPSNTPDYSCHKSVVYPLPYLFFSPSLPPPGFCWGSCAISAFPSLTKMQIKSFTILKPHLFFLLKISGSFIPQWKPLCCLCHRSLFKFRGVMSMRQIKEFWSRNLLIIEASSLRLV